jgi:exodeoxyribonuclease VII small subunit
MASRSPAPTNPSQARQPGEPINQAPELSYEQARAELAEVVLRLETGGTTLEESLSLWERGEALAELCQNWLDGARARLDAARQAPPASSA